LPIQKRYHVILGILIATIILFGIVWSNTHYHHKPDLKSDAISCAVYQSYYETIDTDVRQYFRPNTHKLSSPQYKLSRSQTPREFGHKTTGVKRIEKNGEVIELPIYEPLEFDSTEMIAKLNIHPESLIKHCFFNARSKPQFTTSKKFTSINYSTLNRVSPVAFSDDGQYELIYADQYCGGLCGRGGYYLFQKIDGQWKQIGVSMVWVS